MAVQIAALLGIPGFEKLQALLTVVDVVKAHQQKAALLGRGGVSIFALAQLAASLVVAHYRKQLSEVNYSVIQRLWAQKVYPKVRSRLADLITQAEPIAISHSPRQIYTAFKWHLVMKELPQNAAVLLVSLAAFDAGVYEMVEDVYYDDKPDNMGLYPGDAPRLQWYKDRQGERWKKYERSEDTFRIYSYYSIILVGDASVVAVVAEFRSAMRDAIAVWEDLLEGLCSVPGLTESNRLVEGVRGINRLLTDWQFAWVWVNLRLLEALLEKQFGPHLIDVSIWESIRQLKLKCEEAAKRLPERYFSLDAQRRPLFHFYIPNFTPPEKRETPQKPARERTWHGTRF